MIQQNRLSPVKRSSLCSSPAKSPVKGVKHSKNISCSPFAQQDPYSLQTTLEKKQGTIIKYSPVKKDKENGGGFDLTFTNNEELVNSIHQLSQTFEQREPLSPSKIKLHNNTNSQYSSNMSEMTFSPTKNKGKKSKNDSKRSSISPSKFEKFVKIDPKTLSNPFVTKRSDSKKTHIKNSSIY